MQKVTKGNTQNIRGVITTGSFDPFTLGHFDIAKRAFSMFGNCTCVMLKNDERQYMFTQQQRVQIAQASLKDSPVKFDFFDGTAADYCVQNGVLLVVRGIKSSGEYDYEKRMAEVNKQLCGVETVLLPARLEVSATDVRAVLGSVGTSCQHCLKNAKNPVQSFAKGNAKPARNVNQNGVADAPNAAAIRAKLSAMLAPSAVDLILTWYPKPPV